MKKSYQAVVVVGLLVALGAVFWAINPTTANPESAIGYFNQDVVIEVYAGQQIMAAIEEERRLQELFDGEAAELDDEARWELFLKYEEQLLAYEEELGIPQLLSDIEAALRQSMEAHGVSVVLDEAAVVLGGVDLTPDVLRRLGFSI